MKTVIEMAREAGWTGYDSQDERFEAFAELVAKHTLLNTDPSSFMSYQEGVEAGRLAEREACAKLLDDMAAQDKRTNYYVVAAKAIRARGNT